MCVAVAARDAWVDIAWVDIMRRVRELRRSVGDAAREFSLKSDDTCGTLTE